VVSGASRSTSTGGGSQSRSRCRNRRKGSGPQHRASASRRRPCGSSRNPSILGRNASIARAKAMSHVCDAGCFCPSTDWRRVRRIKRGFPGPAVSVVGVRIEPCSFVADAVLRGGPAFWRRAATTCRVVLGRCRERPWLCFLAAAQHTLLLGSHPGMRGQPRHRRRDEPQMREEEP
jgi:hypothetical protein